MRKESKLKIASILSAAFITTICFSQLPGEKVYAASSIQDLLITEVMPMGQPENDSYEYIEIYNNSDRNIDLKDYKLPLQYLDIASSKAISPKGILVVCTKGSTSLEAFNTFYGTALTSNNFVTLPSTTEVLSNLSASNVLLAKDDGTVISNAQYSSSDFQLKRSIAYKYPETGFNMVLLGQSQTPTPGTITAVQVPDGGVRVTGISMNTSYLTMDVNQRASLYATVAPATATNKAIAWKSSNTSIVEVNDQGALTSKAEGTAAITVTTADGSFSATCTVIVRKIPVTGISLDKGSFAVEIGKAMLLTASVTPENATNKIVQWQSSNSNIASVTTNGIVTGTSAGVVIITATTEDGRKTATCTVTVTPINNIVPVTSISLDKTVVTLRPAQVIVIESRINPSNATNKAVIWSSSNDAVAAVDSSNGIVTAKQQGTATITAATADGGYKAYCQITVSDASAGNIPVTNIQLNTNVMQITKGENKSLSAAISPSNATNKRITWSSDNTAVATVDQNGKVTAVSNGIAVITAITIDGNYKDRCFIIITDNTVTNPKNINLKLNKTSIGIKTGKFEKLNAIITSGNSKCISLVWASSNSKVASVTQDGKVYGKSAGKAVITVSTKDGKFSVKCNVEVTKEKGPGNGNGNSKSKSKGNGKGNNHGKR